MIHAPAAGITLLCDPLHAICSCAAKGVPHLKGGGSHAAHSTDAPERSSGRSRCPHGGALACQGHPAWIGRAL